MKKKITAVLSALIISVSFSISSFAVDTPVSWDDLTEDAQAVGTAYANAFGEYLDGNLLGGALSFRDVPIAYYKFVTDIGWCISPIDDVYYYLSNGELYVDDTNYSGGGGLHSSSHSDTSHHAGKRRVSSGEDLVSDKEFYKSIVKNNPSPIKVSGRLSYKSSLFSDTSNRHKPNLYAEGTFTHDKLREVYLLPFYYDSEADKYYYGQYESYLYMVHGEKDSSTGLVPIDVMIDYCDVTLISASHLTDLWEGAVTCFSGSDYPYARIRININNMYIRAYPDYKSYITTPTNSVKVYNAYTQSHTKINLYDLRDSTFSTYVTPYNAYASCSDTSSNDTGFLFSDTPFILNTSFDFSRIPDTVIIYPSNDNWYIDDTSDTKQGDTIYNYYYNDYIFNTPDNPMNPDDGGDDSGDNSVGGSLDYTKGNVSVSGNVDVSGEIVLSADPIDININVNSGSGSGSDLPPVDDFVEYLPEQSQTMSDYFSIFFSFLPVELLSLLLAGVAVAILCRVLGR